jgi:hypothetical protein
MNNATTTTFETSIGQTEYIRYLHREGAAGNLPSYILVEEVMEQLNEPALERAVHLFVQRHESVRTIFPEVDGIVRQLVLPADERFRVEYIDEAKYGGPYSELRNEYTRATAKMFSHIGTGPLVKFYVIRRKDGSCVFAIYIHHVLCDEWSIGIIDKELSTLYQAFDNGGEPVLPEMTAQLRNYCEQQNNWLRSDREKLIAFWQKRLQGFDAQFDIDAFYSTYHKRKGELGIVIHDFVKPATREELWAKLGRGEGAKYNSIIEGVLFERTAEAVNANKWTITSLVYASLYIYLSTYAAKENILLAALIADRFVPAHQQLIGCLLGATYFPRVVSDETSIDHFVKAVLRDILRSSRKIIPSHEFLELDGAKLLTACDIYVNYVRRNKSITRELHGAGNHYLTNELSYHIECVIFQYTDAIVFEWRYNRYFFGKAIFEDMVQCHTDILGYMISNGNSTVGDLRTSLANDVINIGT